MPKEHFPDEVWIDYARGLLSSARAQLIQVHLDENCESCLGQARLWQTLADVFSREQTYEPDASALHQVQALHLTIPPQESRSRPFRIALLVFDSAFSLATETAGIRSAASTARHVLYRTGRWAIDLRFENEGGKRTHLAGQILRTGRRSGKPPEITVFLEQDDGIVAQTYANQFGEFEFQYESASNLRIQLDIAGFQQIGVPLPNPNK